VLVTGLVEGGLVMRNFYLRNPHGFDRWLKANAVLGSLLAIGMLALPWRVLTLRRDPVARQKPQVLLR